MRTSAFFAPLTLLVACASPLDAPAPAAEASTTNSAMLGDEVLLHGDRSRGVDLSFDWSLKASPSSSKLDERALRDGTSPTASFTPDVSGVYVVALRVCDAWRRCAVSEVDIEIAPATALSWDPGANGASLSTLEDNRPPEASAQASIGRSAGGAPWVFLNGQESSDPDGDNLRYGWSFVSRPADSTIVPGDIAGQGEERAAFQPDVPGTWVLRLTVSDLSTSSTAILEDILINEAIWEGELPE